MDDFHIFEKAASLLEAGQKLALVTVVATTGSTPGKVGYKMLVFGPGRQTLGTVGGGLIEAEMIEQAGQMLSQPNSRGFRFDLGETPDDEKGICGGSVELLVETFGREALPLFTDLVAATLRETPAALLSIIAPDKLPRKILVQDIDHSITDGSVEFTPEVLSAVNRVTATGQGGEMVSAGGMDVFIESLTSSPTVVLFGAGHLSYHIARYARGVHFKVTVCDERPEYANRERFPEADEIVVEDFRRVLDKVRISHRSYAVIVTRGHKCDQIMLEQILQTNARYIGMIGSKRKTQTILDRLGQQGFSEDILGRICSPIGLAIGAVTPEEIALSIVCELVKIRRLGRAAPVGHMALSRPGGRV